MVKEEKWLKDDYMLTWMRDRLLQELVSDRVSGSGKANVKEQLVKLNVNPYFTYPAVAMLAPAAYFHHEHDRLGYMEKIREYLQPRIPAGSVLFLDEEHRLVLLFSWVSKKMLDNVQAMLGEQFSDPITIGVGKPCGYLHEVKHSYEQAGQALQHQFYQGIGEIIYFSELRAYVPLQEYPEHMEKELFDGCKAATSEGQLEEAVKAFYRSVMKGGPIDISHMYELTLRLLVGMERRVLADTDTAAANKPYEILSILKMKTLHELVRCVSEFVTGLWKAVAPYQGESHRSIIKKTMYYMEQECQHVSLQSVAEKVYMTPTYLSLLFKTNTGKTFIEHLTDIRIDKAKAMLKSTHFKNYEVAEKVGYQDSRYFSQIFKKRVGLSPSEYRESAGH